VVAGCRLCAVRPDGSVDCPALLAGAVEPAGPAAMASTDWLVRGAAVVRGAATGARGLGVVVLGNATAPASPAGGRGLVAVSMA
jgi:hypothetical protein